MIDQGGAQAAQLGECSALVQDERPERLFIVRPGNRRLFSVCSEKGGYEWHDLDDDWGTWCVVLGRETTDEKCVRMAKRFNLNADELIALRDDPNWVEHEVHKWGPLQ